MTITDELAAAAVESDQGPPVRPWAVLIELAGVASLETLPDPAAVMFGTVRPPDPRPILTLRFRSHDDARLWCAWFGVAYTDDGEVLMSRLVRWRGYDVAIYGHRAQP